MKKIALTFLFATVLVSSSASAEGLVPVRLAAKDRSSLQSEIAKAKSSSPNAFAQVRDLRNAFPEADKNKRGRFAPITPALVAIGPDALYPMLELLAFGNDSHADLSDNGWITWRAGLVEAVGKLRDARSLPYLAAALETGSPEQAAIIEAAGGAVGRLRTDDAQASLERALRSPDRRLAAVIGLGEARRVKATMLLAALLGEERVDGKPLRTILKALGTAGSSWAWDTIGGATSAEGNEVRLLAARASLEAWARFTGEAREEAYIALSMTEHKDIPALIEQLKAKKGVDKEALNGLSVRVKTLALR